MVNEKLAEAAQEGRGCAAGTELRRHQVQVRGERPGDDCRCAQRSRPSLLPSRTTCSSRPRCRRWAGRNRRRCPRSAACGAGAVQSLPGVLPVRPPEVEALRLEHKEQAVELRPGMPFLLLPKHRVGDLQPFASGKVTVRAPTRSKRKSCARTRTSGRLGRSVRRRLVSASSNAGFGCLRAAPRKATSKDGTPALHRGWPRGFGSDLPREYGGSGSQPSPDGYVSRHPNQEPSGVKGLQLAISVRHLWSPSREGGDHRWIPCGSHLVAT